MSSDMNRVDISYMASSQTLVTTKTINVARREDQLDLIDGFALGYSYALCTLVPSPI